MSTHDPDSERPARGPEDASSEGARVKKNPPQSPREADDEEVISRRPPTSPALRLASWMLALVLLLVVLGWALSTIL